MKNLSIPIDIEGNIQQIIGKKKGRRIPKIYYPKAYMSVLRVL
jgi:hypothetical protein